MFWAHTLRRFVAGDTQHGFAGLGTHCGGFKAGTCCRAWDRDTLRGLGQGHAVGFGAGTRCRVWDRDTLQGLQITAGAAPIVGRSHQLGVAQLALGLGAICSCGHPAGAGRVALDRAMTQLGLNAVGKVDPQARTCKNMAGN